MYIMIIYDYIWLNITIIFDDFMIIYYDYILWSCIMTVYDYIWLYIMIMYEYILWIYLIKYYDYIWL